LQRLQAPSLGTTWDADGLQRRGRR
jgi:hypothetical protein